MSGASVKCASCASFPLADAVGAQNSRALCRDFETMRRWDYPACPLYEYAKDTINQRKAHVKEITSREKETMQNFDTKAGDIWQTAMGHKVRVLARAIPEIIETEYVDGPIDGKAGISFDLATGCAVQNGDALVERVDG